MLPHQVTQHCGRVHVRQLHVHAMRRLHQHGLVTAHGQRCAESVGPTEDREGGGGQKGEGERTRVGGGGEFGADEGREGAQQPRCGVGESG